MKIIVEKTEDGFMIKTNDKILHKDDNTVVIGSHFDSRHHEVVKEKLDAKNILKQMLSDIDSEEEVKKWAELNHFKPIGMYAACYRMGLTDCLRKLEKMIK